MVRCPRRRGGRTDVDRAALLIGVQQAGNLPVLQAVRSGIRAMQEWATSQKICGDRLILLTDEVQPVRAHQIADAIDAFVQLGTIEQLVVYFSGHGIYNRGELWLLSRSPGQAGEAVNVEGSALLARYCGIPHVVFISDACRTAASGIQALHVTGTEVFPNEPPGGRESPVDIFFACSRGNPAYEVRSPDDSAREFSALYTEVLSECLHGEYSDIVDAIVVDGKPEHVVRARRLRDRLAWEVPRRLQARLQRNLTINQLPDARVNSDDAWISRLSRSAAKPAFESAVPRIHLRTAGSDPAALATAMIAAASAGRLERWRDDLSEGEKRSALLRYYDGLARATPARWSVAPGNVGTTESSARNVLALLGNGEGVVLPREATGYELRLVGGMIADIGYGHLRSEALQLRLVLATAANNGLLRLDHALADTLFRRLREGEPDPGAMVYAAYVFHEMQRTDLVRALRDHARMQGTPIFDLELLGGAAMSKEAADLPAGSIPLLAQGWSLARALRAGDRLEELETNLRSSHWTLLDPVGVQIWLQRYGRKIAPMGAS